MGRKARVVLLGQGRSELQGTRSTRWEARRAHCYSLLVLVKAQLLYGGLDENQPLLLKLRALSILY